MGDRQLGSDVDVHRMYVGGEWTSASSDRTLPVIDPSSESVIGHLPAASESDVHRATEAATEAAPAWAATPWTERAAILVELARRISAHTEELAMLDTVDAGNPITGMRGDMALASGELRYFAGLGGELKGTTIPWTATQFAQTLREPYGVVGRITAFNHPLMFAASKSAAPLMAGNAVVLKPSEHTSLSSLKLAEMAADLLPPGTFNVVTGTGPEAGGALVRHPGVPRIAFTGGVPTGREVLSAGGEQVKHVTVELGGKNPMVVFPDVQPVDAATGAVAAMNLRRSMGQSCQSSSRVLVHEDVAEPFTERLVEQVQSLKVGDPRLDDTDMGPLAFESHYKRVLGYIEAGQVEGATLAAGGGRPPGLEHGYYVQPTVFTDVRPDMRIANEEIFGPVISILAWNDYDEMIRVANGVSFGLTANVWTNDLSMAHRTAARLQAGLVWVNGEGKKPPGVPFGGYKQSGLGKENALGELLSYTREKSVVINLR